MATLLPLGIQYFDGEGVPLASGTLTFYIASSTTPLAIYNNAGQSSQLTNPFVLDSEGRIPAAGIWGIGSYRVILKTSGGVTIADVDNLNLYNPFDWTGLTASIADINSISGSLGTAGVVVASKAVVVDASKNISTFGTVTVATLRANTAVRTPQINDANNIAALTIANVPSQVDSLTLTPCVTGGNVTVSATGSDTDIGLVVSGKGAKGVIVGGTTLPLAAGTSGQIMQTDGTTATWVNPALRSDAFIYSTATTTTSAILPRDDTIPQNTEGAEVLSLSITPKLASSTLHYEAVIFAGITAASGSVSAAVFRDSTVDAVGASCTAFPLAAGAGPIVVTGSVPSTAIVSTTLKVRIGPSVAGTAMMNGNGTTRIFGGVAQSTLRIWEV